MVLVSLSCVLYVVVFPYARTIVGDVVGALSSVPVLIAGNLLTRKKTWLVALLLIAVNGVLFAVTEGESCFTLTLPAAPVPAELQSVA